MQKIVSLGDSLDLPQFLKENDALYKESVNNLSLFNQGTTPQFWSPARIKWFVKVFYHARGHFHDFLWMIANHSKSAEFKKTVLMNIAEELNGTACSHEEMYWIFAKEHGINIQEEILSEDNYIPFVRGFNKGHVKWLYENDEESRMAAFAAYERLDNIDYINLYEVAKAMGTSTKGLAFFKVHVYVKHFESVEEYIEKIWEKDNDKVIRAFNFIYEHQINLWKNIGASLETI